MGEDYIAAIAGSANHLCRRIVVARGKTPEIKVNFTISLHDVNRSEQMGERERSGREGGERKSVLPKPYPLLFHFAYFSFMFPLSFLFCVCVFFFVSFLLFLIKIKAT